MKIPFNIVHKNKQVIKRVYELKPIGQAYWILETSHGKRFSIDDVSMTCDFKGPMKFKKTDALKLQRFLNNYYKGKDYIFHWKTYDLIKDKLNLETGVWAQ